MEISELQDFVAENVHGGDGENIGLDLLVVKIGQYATYRLQLEDTPGRQRDDILGDILAAMVMVVTHAAEDEGIDVESYVENRVDTMQEGFDREEEFFEAIEDGDYEKIADMIEDDVGGGNPLGGGSTKEGGSKGFQ